MENAADSGKWSRREQSRYFFELRSYFIASVLLITAGTAFGLLASTYVLKLSSTLEETLKEFAKPFLGLPKPYLALAIFLNNGLKTLVVMVAGFLGVIVPLIFLMVNGIVLGIVLHVAIQSKGLSAFMLAVVPHGLFELPAVLLGTSIGFMLGVRTIKRVFGNGDKTMVRELARGLRFFLTVIVPLLLFAAFVEAFITSSVVR